MPIIALDLSTQLAIWVHSGVEVCIEVAGFELLDKHGICLCWLGVLGKAQGNRVQAAGVESGVEGEGPCLDRLGVQHKHDWAGD